MDTAEVKTIRATNARGTSQRACQSGESPNTMRKNVSTPSWIVNRTSATPTVDRASSSRGKATFLMIPALPTTTVVELIDETLKRFQARRPQNSQIAKWG